MNKLLQLLLFIKTGANSKDSSSTYVNDNPNNYDDNDNNNIDNSNNNYDYH